jgi:hypothetical protein
VRVPVFVGHSEAVNVEFEKPITAEEARQLERSAPIDRLLALAMEGASLTGFPSLAGRTKTPHVCTFCAGHWGSMAPTSCANPRWRCRLLRDLDHAARTCSWRRSVTNREPCGESQEQCRENRCAELFSHKASPCASAIPGS